MLTGRYPLHFGIYSNADIDSHGVPTNFTLLPALPALETTTLPSGSGIAVNEQESIATQRGESSFLGMLQRLLDARIRARDSGSCGATVDGIHDRAHVGEYSTFVYAREAARILRITSHPRPIYLYLSFQAVQDHTSARTYAGMYENVSHPTMIVTIWQ